MNTVTLPEYDDMVARLDSVSDDSYIRQRFHPLILKDAGSKLAATGVVMMLELAIDDFAKRSSLPTGSLMRMHIKGYITALIDDEVAREEALQFVDQVNTEAQKQLDARPPAPPRVELGDEDKSKLMRHIKQIARIFDEHVSDHGASSRGHRDGGVNSFYDQTLDGIFLEFYYGGPSKLWTPWGYWHFAAAQSHQTDLEAFMAHFETRVHIEEHNTAMGTIGPVYAILAIDGEALPEPILPTDRRQYVPFEDAKADWEKFFTAN